MLIAYLTTDEVNQAVAAQMAEECEAAHYPLWQRDRPPEGRFDAVLYDLDYLSPPQRQEVLRGLLGSPPPYPVAVHSYHLDEDEVRGLLQNRVAVGRRLDLGLFTALRQAVGSVRAALRHSQRSREPVFGRLLAFPEALASHRAAAGLKRVSP